MTGVNLHEARDLILIELTSSIDGELAGFDPRAARHADRVTVLAVTAGLNRQWVEPRRQRGLQELFVGMLQPFGERAVDEYLLIRISEAEVARERRGFPVQLVAVIRAAVAAVGVIVAVDLGAEDLQGDAAPGCALWHEHAVIVGGNLPADLLTDAGQRQRRARVPARAKTARATEGRAVLHGRFCDRGNRRFDGDDDWRGGWLSRCDDNNGGFWRWRGGLDGRDWFNHWGRSNHWGGHGFHHRRWLHGPANRLRRGGSTDGLRLPSLPKREAGSQYQPSRENRVQHLQTQIHRITSSLT